MGKKRCGGRCSVSGRGSRLEVLSRYTITQSLLAGAQKGGLPGLPAGCLSCSVCAVVSMPQDFVHILWGPRSVRNL
eukprot:1512989-Amphidinium_carterae.1